VAATRIANRKTRVQRNPQGKPMKPQDRYLKFVRWEEQDGLYVGYCPDLFPFGGVCHGATEEETYRELTVLVAEEVAELQRAGQELPPPSTRPMREAVPA
jgi:predicted RNase H-like HicB family nuclease